MALRVMRDMLIEKVYECMLSDESIFFVSADLGAPALDKLRANFPDRFINVGIAEQNSINVATGLALEGFKVYAYGIALFITMRAYEQIRTNISVLTQIRDININLIGVGSGLSYDVVGPTHHCLEDSCIMNVLPGFTVFSPSDAVLSGKFVDYTLQHSGPKYVRLDGKAQPELYAYEDDIPFDDGFCELRKGKDICIVSTGYMTHVALEIFDLLRKYSIQAGVVDQFLLKPFNKERLLTILRQYRHVVTMEEAFINKGGLDTIVEHLCFSNRLFVGMTKIGFSDKYVFDVGDREHLYKVNNLDLKAIIETIKSDLKKGG
ncbi:Transketolase, C-terminal section (EC [Olavius sp. associated proteobacterium Delta 1]|nr:Transketolase, C-terminal section (EC [Olavius sp. associated proteobacterium Delta 1]